MSPPVDSTVRVSFLGEVSVLCDSVDWAAVHAFSVGVKVGKKTHPTSTAPWSDDKWVGQDEVRNTKSDRFRAAHKQHTKRNKRERDSTTTKTKQAQYRAQQKARDKSKRFDRQAKDVLVRTEQYDVSRFGHDYYYDYNYDGDCRWYPYQTYVTEDFSDEMWMWDVLDIECPLRKRFCATAADRKRHIQKSQRKKHVSEQAKQRNLLRCAQKKARKARDRKREAEREAKKCCPFGVLE